MTRNQQPDASTALAQRRDTANSPAIKSLGDQIQQMEREYQRAMPRGMEATQLIRDALTSLRMNPKLAECDAPSVLGGLMTCAQLGLRPGVLGHAWLLPFWDSKTRGQRAQLVIGYQGYVDLAYRSGRVKSLAARTVYTADYFELEYHADGDRMIHKPELDNDRGQPRLFYARAQLADGGYALTDPMSVAQMQQYRDKHAKARTRDGKIFGPWIDEFEGMSHKTTIRRLAKLLPKSTELVVAMAVDDGVRVDLRPTIDAAEVTEDATPVMEGVVVEDETGGADPDADPTLSPDQWPAVRQPGDAS